VSLLSPQLDAVETSMPMGVRGTVQSIAGLTIEASGLPLPLGSLCAIHSFGQKQSTAEVIGFRQDRTLLMPLTTTAGVARGDTIQNLTSTPRIWCSPQVLGRVLNGLGNPIDGLGPLPMGELRRLDAAAPAPMDRHNIRQPISTSIRSIDGLLTCGLGQRMGIFAGPGVGKSVLISNIAKYTSADVSVVALIGERGREVQEFLHNTLGKDGLRRCVVVVSTGDEPALMRVRAAKAACTIAEFFRDRGKHVLLIMDSLTRLCHAQRQIGLAASEPPATKGYPPSVFALLPQVLERAGKTQMGSVTGFYTVLVEGDDFNEPIPDAVKGITDGHIWLNRALANRGHYPAVDVVQSISRVRGDVCDAEQQKMARRVLSLVATYADIEDLVNIGAYVPGANPDYDLAVQARPRILAFLQQGPGVACTLPETRKQLGELNVWVDQLEKVIRTKSQPAKTPAQKQPPQKSA
jgi:flagellum-specific ATP synthase